MREVDDEILAGFEAGREGEWSDHEMEMGMMYDEEEDGEVMHQDEDEGDELIHEDEEESGKAVHKGNDRDNGQSERPSKRSRSL